MTSESGSCGLVICFTKRIRKRPKARSLCSVPTELGIGSVVFVGYLQARLCWKERGLSLGTAGRQQDSQNTDCRGSVGEAFVGLGGRAQPEQGQ